jgi:hypothetical protein
VLSSSVDESSTTSDSDAVEVTLSAASDCAEVDQYKGSDTTSDVSVAALASDRSSNETVSVSVLEVVKHDLTEKAVRVHNAGCKEDSSVVQSDVLRSVPSVPSTLKPTVAKVLTVIPEFERSGSSSPEISYTRLFNFYTKHTFIARGENSTEYTLECRADLKIALYFMDEKDSSELFLHAKSYFESTLPNRGDVLAQYQILASAASKFLPGVTERELSVAAHITPHVIECMDLVGGWSSVGGGREERTRWVARGPIYTQLLAAAISRPGWSYKV